MNDETRQKTQPGAAPVVLVNAEGVRLNKKGKPYGPQLSQKELSLLPLSEVAARLGVRRTTARTWIREGRIRAHRFGSRCYRVSPNDLAAFIKAHETVEPALPGEGRGS